MRFVDKWALSPNRLVFWVISPVCPITVVSELDSERVACGVGGLEEPAVPQRGRWPYGGRLLWSIVRYETCPTSIVKCKVWGYRQMALT